MSSPREVYLITNGHCHMCGDPIEFEKRGWATDLRGYWEIDHVGQRGSPPRDAFEQVDALKVLMVKNSDGRTTIHRFLMRAKPGKTGCGKDAKGAQPSDRPRFELLPGEDASLCRWCERVIKQEGPAGVAIRNAACADVELPACTSCNRLRWMHSGDDFRQLLRLGLIAREEIKRGSDLGRRLESLQTQRASRNVTRRRGMRA